MCSTPRSSEKVRTHRKLNTSRGNFTSYSQMMRKASQQYEQRQEERRRRHQILLEQENKSVQS